jgi:hypothetical protein
VKTILAALLLSLSACGAEYVAPLDGGVIDAGCYITVIPALGDCVGPAQQAYDACQTDCCRSAVQAGFWECVQAHPTL